MTALPPPPTPPGWYPDPWYPASMRWFDGSTWTEHATALGPQADPYDAAKGASSAKWAGYAFLARAATSALQALFLPAILSNQIREFFDTWNDPEAMQSSDPFGLAGFNVLSQVASLFMMGCLVFLCIWTFRATTNARAVGLTTSYSPGLTVGAWIIPFANFVMPWQSVRDLFPPDHPGRRQAGLWWTFELLAMGTVFVAYGMAIWLGGGVGTAVGFVAAAFAISAGVLGNRLCREVVRVHTDLAELRGHTFAHR